MTHAEATKLVLGKNNRMQRKVGNNTTARIKPDGSVAIHVYSTDIVTIHDDDSVTLRHGGHKTPTTKDRINRLVLFMYSKKIGNGTVNGIAAFEDGMTIKA